MILWYRLLYQVIRPLIPLLDLSHNSSLAPPQGNGTTAHTHTPHTPHHVYQPPAVYMVMSSTVFPVICLGVVIILAFLLGGLVYYYCTRWDIMVFHESERGVSHFCLKTEPPSLSIHSLKSTWQTVFYCGKWHIHALDSLMVFLLSCYHKPLPMFAILYPFVFPRVRSYYKYSSPATVRYSSIQVCLHHCGIVTQLHRSTCVSVN